MNTPSGHAQLHNGKAHHQHDHRSQREQEQRYASHSPVESRMAVTDGWHHSRMNHPHPGAPHHGYPPPVEWNGYPPSHHVHHQHHQQLQQQHPHYLPPPDSHHHDDWRASVPRSDIGEPGYGSHHHHAPPHHHRPTASPPHHRGHVKADSRDNFLPPPLGSAMGPPSERGSPLASYEHLHPPAKIRRQPTPGRYEGYENGDWGHKRKRSEGHDQYGPVDRAAWGPYPHKTHQHPPPPPPPPAHIGGHYLHPDAPPSWGQPSPMYEQDYARMQPPAPRKVSSHHSRNKSIEDARARKTTQPPPSPGHHRNGSLLHSQHGSPYDPPSRLPRAATEEVSRQVAPPSLHHQPQHHHYHPGASTPEMMEADPHFPHSMAPSPKELQAHAAASQPPPVARTIKDEASKQRASEAKRQRDAAKQNELALQREREREREQQQQQQQHEAEMRRAAAMQPPPSRAQRPPSPSPPMAHQQPGHYEMAPGYLPGSNGYGPQAHHHVGPHGPADFGPAATAHPHSNHHNEAMVDPTSHHRPIAPHPASDIYLEQQRQQQRMPTPAAIPQGDLPPHAQQTHPASAAPFVQRARILSDPIWQWFDELAAAEKAAGPGAGAGAGAMNVRVGTWTYAPHKQPLLPGDLLSSRIGGLVEVRLRGADLGPYREISDPRAQVGWTLGWRARHAGVRVDVSNQPLPSDAARQSKADAQTRLCLAQRKLWGSEVYTDDSDVLAMCIHSGWIEFPSAASGEARQEHQDIEMYSPPDIKVTLRIAPRLVSYKDSFGGGLVSRNWFGRHDGVSLVVEGVELMDKGYASAISLPGHRGVKAGAARHAKLSAKRAVLEHLDRLVMPMQQDSDARQQTLSSLVASLDSRKQSVFPLSDVRRGGDAVGATGKHNDTEARAKDALVGISSKSSSGQLWWNLSDVLSHRLNGSAAFVVSQKA